MNSRLQEILSQFKPYPIRIPVNKYKLENTVEAFFSLMFPVGEEFDRVSSLKKLDDVAHVLLDNVAALTSPEFAENVITLFFERLPAVLEQLLDDANTYLQSDPAAKSLEEVLITYPGFFALSVHRIAHELHKLDIPVIPRLFSEYAHAKVGIDIHPGAKIGKNFFMDHGTGIVIGETTEIGDNVKIYQGVTLGAMYLEKKLSDVKRHPTVENNVIIYSGATILGGETVIGHHSVIGGGAWLTRSVIPYSLVYNKVDVKVRTVKDFEEPLDFVI
ncbi:MAG: serine O-acetyltransferase [Dysgonamonadaceae bacterium]|jgi:serine O-acetyltransferase|nr:serine O-acetyltransferase [Dysgonamonadaceae bacterium]